MGQNLKGISMKKILKFYLAGFILLTISSEFSPTIVSASSTITHTDTRFNRSYNKLKKINQELLLKLSSEQTNSEINQKHKFNADLDWTKFIKNVRYLKNNQLEIYTNDNFKKLSNSHRQAVINVVQRFSFNIVSDFKNLPETTFTDGLAALIFWNGSCLGQSEYMNNKEFTWKK